MNDFMTKNKGSTHTVVKGLLDRDSSIIGKSCSNDCKKNEWFYDHKLRVYTYSSKKFVRLKYTCIFAKCWNEENYLIFLLSIDCPFNSDKSQSTLENLLCLYYN